MPRDASESSGRGGTTAGTVRCSAKMRFSDESISYLFGNQARTYVRRFHGEEFKPECLNLMVKHILKTGTAWLIVDLDIVD